MKFLFVFATSLLLLCALVHSMPPVNVIANVRGKKYEVSAETVDEFSVQVESLTGLEASKQSILYKGKVLSNNDKFDDLGIESGEVLNVVKGRRTKIADATQKIKHSDTKTRLNGLEDAMEDSGDAETPMSMEQMQKAKQAMEQMLDSDFIDEYFSDDEKLETARQQLLSNLEQYEKMMPGFKEQAEDIASSPEKWREAMLKVKEQMMALKRQRDQSKASGSKPDSR